MNRRGPMTRGPSPKALRRALSGPFFSPAWHQGYFEARDVCFTIGDRPTAIRYRSQADRDRRAAGRLEAPPGSSLEGRQAVLDYIDGAWCFLEIACLMPL